MGGPPGCEPRYAQNAGAHRQAPVLRPWASPGHSAEEFRRRAGLSSRGLKSCARVTWTTLSDSALELFSRTSHADSSGGEFREESCSHDGETGYVATAFEIF